MISVTVMVVVDLTVDSMWALRSEKIVSTTCPCEVGGVQLK